MRGATLGAALLAASAVAAQLPEGWELFGPDAIGITREQVAGQLPLQCTPEQEAPEIVACQPAAGVQYRFAGMPLQKLVLTFRNDRLEKVAGRFAESRFEAFEQFITARAGPGRDCSTQFRGGMGTAEFVNRILLWRAPGYALVIQQYEGKIDRSAFSFGSEAAMADVVREKTSYPPGTRRDL